MSGQRSSTERAVCSAAASMSLHAVLFQLCPSRTRRPRRNAPRAVSSSVEPGSAGVHMTGAGRHQRTAVPAASPPGTPRGLRNTSRFSMIISSQLRIKTSLPAYRERHPRRAADFPSRRARARRPRRLQDACRRGRRWCPPAARPRARPSVRPTTDLREAPSSTGQAAGPAARSSRFIGRRGSARSSCRSPRRGPRRSSRALSPRRPLSSAFRRRSCSSSGMRCAYSARARLCIRQQAAPLPGDDARPSRPPSRREAPDVVYHVRAGLERERAPSRYLYVSTETGRPVSRFTASTMGRTRAASSAALDRRVARARGLAAHVDYRGALRGHPRGLPERRVPFRPAARRPRTSPGSGSGCP